MYFLVILSALVFGPLQILEQLIPGAGQAGHEVISRLMDAIIGILG